MVGQGRLAAFVGVLLACLEEGTLNRTSYRSLAFRRSHGSKLDMEPPVFHGACPLSGLCPYSWAYFYGGDAFVAGMAAG